MVHKRRGIKGSNMKRRTKIIALVTMLLSAIMLMLGTGMVAFAEGEDELLPNSITYIDEDGSEQTLTRSQFKIVGKDIQPSDPLGDGWYVYVGGAVLRTRVEVTGDAKIILCDRNTLHFMYGINVPEGTSLSIYAQTTDRNSSGKLVAEGNRYNAGIGGNVSSKDKANKCGTINVYGGIIEATGGYGAAGIGGGNAYCYGSTRNGGDGGEFFIAW